MCLVQHTVLNYTADKKTQSFYFKLNTSINRLFNTLLHSQQKGQIFMQNLTNDFSYRIASSVLIFQRNYWIYQRFCFSAFVFLLLFKDRNIFLSPTLFNNYTNLSTLLIYCFTSIFLWVYSTFILSPLLHFLYCIFSGTSLSLLCFYSFTCFLFYNFENSH